LFKLEIPGLIKKKLKPAVKKKEKKEQPLPVKKQEPVSSKPAPTASDLLAESLKTKEFLPVRVSKFDALVEKGGVERGNTLLVAGGCGTGKSTFTMQSLYHGVQKGEKGVYLSFEEPVEKLRRHMKANYGWDLAKYEKQGNLALLMLDPFKIARSVEASVMEKSGDLMVDVEQMDIPFVPDRVVVDSLSALSIAFMGNVENYRYYIRNLFEKLDEFNSVNFVISETEMDPGVYSRSGIEEFLSDGVIVLYNLREGKKRERALEVLKLRCSDHVKKLVPYAITKKGITIKAKKGIMSEALSQGLVKSSGSKQHGSHSGLPKSPVDGFP
jgi:circadian clock protein KaiC